MGTELIQAKLGFDTSEFVAGTDAAKARAQGLEKDMLKADASLKQAAGSVGTMSKNADTLKTTLGPVNEMLGKIGLSTIAPLAAFGKMATAIWEFGKNAKNSSVDAERELYKLTTTAEGLGDKMVKVGAGLVGTLATFGRDIGTSIVAATEQIGIMEQGTYEYANEVERAERAAARNAAAEEQVKKETEQINALKKQQAEQDFASLPISVQLEKLEAKKAEAAERVKAAGDNIVLARRAELAQMQANQAYEETLVKARSSEEYDRLKSLAVLKAAQDKYYEDKKKAEDEIRQKSRLGRDEEIERIILTQKGVDHLNKQELDRLKTLDDQKKLKEIQVKIDEILTASGGVTTSEQNKQVVQLTKQRDLLMNQIDLRNKLIPPTVKVAQVSAATTDQVITQNGWLKSNLELMMQLQGKVSYVGNPSTLTNYEIDKQLNAMRQKLDDIRVKDLASPFADTYYFEEKMVRSVVDQLSAEAAKREAERKLEAKSKAYDEAKYGTNESADKFGYNTQLQEQMKKYLEVISKLRKNAGLSAPAGKNTGG